jgi:alpha-L-rhamnosidase
MRVPIEQDPFLLQNSQRVWRERGLWPAQWIDCPAAGEPPFVTAYRLRFSLPAAATIRLHVTADERYSLYLNGRRVGGGPERGDPYNWFYESYDLALPAGDHTLVARVWSLGEKAAMAQMSVHPGFLLAAEGDWTPLLSTGLANWEAKRLIGYDFIAPRFAHWRGHTTRIDGAAYPWGVEQGAGEGWQPARPLGHGVGQIIDWEYYKIHVLKPAPLPSMLDQPVTSALVRHIASVNTADTAPVPVRAADHLPEEGARWQALLAGQGIATIPPESRRRLIIDLGDYHCAYSEITTSGGAGSRLRLHWAESLAHDYNRQVLDKGHRGEIDGKHFTGFGDEFLPDGESGRTFTPLWWNAGRYVELLVETAAQPLTVDRLIFRETRYPLPMDSRFESSEPRLDALTPLCVRALQATAHETYFDSPYYEEMMYAGDTRLECLITYVMTRDDRLPRKALALYDASHLPDGLTQARYPCRVTQIIGPFCLWWVGMVYEYAHWRDDPDFVRQIMPGVRATLEAFRRYIDPQNGLLRPLPGWNTLDWVPEWEAGCPPDAVSGYSGVLHWQLIYSLTLAADLEQKLNEPELAARLRRWQAELAGAGVRAFWDDARGLLADTPARETFSEHTQCFALLSGVLDENQQIRLADGLFSAPDLSRATIYFSHYLLETCRERGRMDVYFQRLADLWYPLLDKGLKTTLEQPEPSRSDCHGWSAHPLFHHFATILGIRPASLGFRTVEIRPQLGSLTRAAGTLVHPQGAIRADFRVEDGRLLGEIELPAGVTGTLVYNGQSRVLAEGVTTLA